MYLAGQAMHHLTRVVTSNAAATVATASRTAGLRAAEHRTTWQAAAHLPMPVMAAVINTATATAAATITTGMAAGANISTLIDLLTAA